MVWSDCSMGQCTLMARVRVLSGSRAYIHIADWAPTFLRLAGVRDPRARGTARLRLDDVVAAMRDAKGACAALGSNWEEGGPRPGTPEASGEEGAEEPSSQKSKKRSKKA